MPTWPSPMLAAGFTYASDTEPSNPKEGETWYDTNANEAKVYDGAGWQRLTVTDHGELGSVSAGQHRSDSNIRSTVDGQVDADTVDGQHASDLGASSTQASGTDTSNWHRVVEPPGSVDVYAPVNRQRLTEDSEYGGTMDYTLNFSDGSTISGSVSNGSTEYYDKKGFLLSVSTSHDASDPSYAYGGVYVYFPGYVGQHSHSI